MSTAPPNISNANTHDVSKRVAVVPVKRTYGRIPKENVSTNLAKGESVQSSPKTSKWKVAALKLDVANDFNISLATKGQNSIKTWISVSADNTYVVPSKDVVEETNHKWSPMGQ